MASAGDNLNVLTAGGDHLKALSQLRTRLSQLSTSMGLLRDHLANETPLPKWPTLQADATTLGASLQELADLLNSQRALFTSMHPYPLPNFPATTQEMTLHGLLRKKLDPVAENWIDSSLRSIKNVEEAGAGTDTLPEEDVQVLWGWAAKASREILTTLIEDMDDDYTILEREQGTENIVTGIKRLDEDEDDDENEEMEDVKPTNQELAMTQVKGMDLSRPPLLLDNILRFTSGYQRPAV